MIHRIIKNQRINMIWTNLVEDHPRYLHTKFECNLTSGSREEVAQRKTPYKKAWMITRIIKNQRFNMIWTNLEEDYLRYLQTKHECNLTSGSREEVVQRKSPYKAWMIHRILSNHRIIMIWTNLVEDHPRYLQTKFESNLMSSFREEVTFCRIRIETQNRKKNPACPVGLFC